MPKLPPQWTDERIEWPRSVVARLLILFAGCTINTAISGDAFAGSPATRPSDLPLGQPAWLRLDSRSLIRKGEEEKALFDISREPQWFGCYDRPVTKQEYQAYEKKIGERSAAAEQPDRSYSIPVPLRYPKELDELPDDDRGVRLTLKIEPAGDSPVLDFTLVLTSSGRAVWSDLDWRPFLFAFFVDGKPVLSEARRGYFGGIEPQSEFVISDGGGERRWRFRVKGDSVQDLLPDKQAHALTVVAAFSERKPEEKRDIEFDGNPLPPKGHEGPQVLVRSNVATIKWTGKNWIGGEAKQ